MLQYLCEGVLATALATPVALAALQIAIAFFDKLTGLHLDGPWRAGLPFWAVVVALLLAAGAASAIYPALVLARVRPIAALRAGAVRAGPKPLRSVLIGSQFAVASFLLIAVIVVIRQNAELKHSAFGTGRDPLVVIPIRLQAAGIDPEAFRSRLEASPHIKAVTGASVAPWELQVGGSGYTRTAGKLSTVQFIQTQSVSYGYFAALGTRVLAGRTFSRDRDRIADEDSKAEPKAVIDRLTAVQFGWTDPSDAIGKTLYSASSTMLNGRYSPMTIIGVVEHAPPRVFGWMSKAFIYSLDRNDISFPIIEISRDDIPAALADIDSAWKDLAPSYPLTRQFADERFDHAYRIFEYISRGFTMLAAFAFVIAVTGLVGMTLFISARRRHEMGVRKVLGASSRRLLGTMLADYLRPVIAANLVAWPLALLAAKTYVDLFIHPVPLSPVPFLLSLGITTLVSLAVVGRQALILARVKPANVLRYE